MSSFIPSPGWKPNLNAIPQFTDWGSWAVDISWHFLEKFIASQVEDTGLDLDPDFQRAHVWTPAQQVAFVEFKLQGGHSGSSLLSNCTGFHIGSKVGPHVLVDGKQRLEAVRKFMRGELRAFGHTLAEYGGTLRPTKHSFRWHINDLPDRASVLKWYCEINAGGTPHTVEEIQRVRDLLQQEEEKEGARTQSR